MKYISSISGGKDSLYMLNYILRHSEQYPLDYVVHFELEIDYPFVAEVISLVEKICELNSIHFLRLKPKKSYNELKRKYGLQTRMTRWCNNVYKLSCLKELKEIVSEKFVQYIGICADEKKRIRTSKNIIYPLVNANINESDVLSWARKQSVFKGYYHYNKRQGCWCCPLISMTELAYQKVFYPNLYDQFSSMIRERENERNKPYFHCFFSEIEKRITEKYIPRIKENQLTLF